MTLAEQIHARICERSGNESTVPSNLDLAIAQLLGELAPLTPTDEALSLIHI